MRRISLSRIVEDFLELKDYLESLGYECTIDSKSLYAKIGGYIISLAIYKNGLVMLLPDCREFDCDPYISEIMGFSKVLGRFYGNPEISVRICHEENITIFYLNDIVVDNVESLQVLSEEYAS